MTNDKQGVGFRPSSDFSDPVRTSRDYGESRTGFKITGRVALHPFKKVVKRISRSQGITATLREWTKEIAYDGWGNPFITSLRILSENIDDISLWLDDEFVDTVLASASNYTPKPTERSFINIPCWNEGVKNDIVAQAEWCGMTASIYVQAMLIARALSRLDWCRSKHIRSMEYGKSEEPMREVAKKFSDWLVFRRTQLEFLKERYSILRA